MSIIYFSIYAIIGYIIEVVFCSISQRRFVNRGFLFGPAIPIYGFGALAILWSTSGVADNLPLTFLVSLLACSILEYCTSLLLEKIFHVRWWDYSTTNRFNLNGRICLKNSLIFGVCGVAVVHWLHPNVRRAVLWLNPPVRLALALILLGLFLVDAIASFCAVKRTVKIIDLSKAVGDRTNELKRQCLKMVQQFFQIWRGADKSELAQRAMNEFEKRQKMLAEKLSAKLRRPSKSTIFFLLPKFLVFLVVMSLTAAILTIAIVPASQKLFEILRNFCLSVNPKILDFTSAFFYDVLVTLTIIGFTSLVGVLLWRRFFPREIVRNYKYILKLFDSGNERLPVASKEILARRLSGGSKKDIALVLDVISQSLQPIESFLRDEDSSETILTINSKWGTGKTSAVLMAIQDVESDENRSVNNVIPDNRYIYESVFKYRQNLDEFIDDLLSSLRSTLLELGVNTRRELDALAKNIDSSLSRTIFSSISTGDDKAKLSTELLLEVNQKYQKRGIKRKIIVIVDDLDRMQGQDILSTISLLSILRRLSFVKIIIPADLQVVIKALKEIKFVDPDRFLEKYLPEQSAIAINSSYDYVIAILEEKLKHICKAPKTADVTPAIYAMLVKVLSDKLGRELEGVEVSNYRWLKPGSTIPNEIKGVARVILSAPQFFSTFAPYSKSYSWTSTSTDFRHFENLFLNLTDAKTGRRILFDFNATQYDHFVVVGFSLFLSTNWDKFGITLRDLLDICHTPTKEFLWKKQYEHEPQEFFYRVLSGYFSRIRLYDRALNQAPFAKIKEPSDSNIKRRESSGEK